MSDIDTTSVDENFKKQMTTAVGGAMPWRPLHFIWICDTSESMKNEGKIEALNQAIRSAIPKIHEEMKNYPKLRVQMTAIQVSSGAEWVSDDFTFVGDYEWKDLTAAGATDLGHAFTKIAEKLSKTNMPARGFAPHLILISDGGATDDWAGGLAKIFEVPWGNASVRIAIGIRGADPVVLETFVGKEFAGKRIINVDKPDELAEAIVTGSMPVPTMTVPDLITKKTDNGAETSNDLSSRSTEKPAENRHEQSIPGLKQDIGLPAHSSDDPEPF